MSSVKDWTASVIKQAEIDKYLDGGKDFIDEEQIFADIESIRIPITTSAGIFYKNLWI